MRFLRLTEDDASSGLTVAEATFRELLRIITAGDLAFGSDVTEEGLAAQLKVSRTPLRDALRRLEGLGLVVRRSNRTIFVPPLSPDEMRDLSITREALEASVVREVARLHREGKIALEGLEAIHSRMKQLATLDDNTLALDAGLDFHHELYTLSNLSIAAGILNQIIIRIERYRQLTKGNIRRTQGVVEEHDIVLAALRCGDEKAAEVAMRNHLCAARAVYLEKLAYIRP